VEFQDDRPGERGFENTWPGAIVISEAISYVVENGGRWSIHVIVLEESGGRTPRSGEPEHSAYPIYIDRRVAYRLLVEADFRQHMNNVLWSGCL